MGDHSYTAGKGLDWLPDAIRKPHPRAFPWQGSAPCKGVIHTTETSGRAGYRNWTVMPHAEVMPIPGKGVEIVQFLPFSQGSFALVNASGGVNTNGLHAFQFELVGTSEKGGPGLCWPEADDAVLLDLFKKVVQPLSDAFGIPLAAPVFLPYPQSYGNTAVRLSGQTWVNFNGWCGHQHVPENVHGDPGAFPFARMIRLGGQQPNQLVVDGVLGAATIRRWQEVLNTHGAKPQLVTDGLLGPATWTAVDVWLGVTPPNGVAGRDTIRALQRELGITVDGILGRDTIRALQRKLNTEA